MTIPLRYWHKVIPLMIWQCLRHPGTSAVLCIEDGHVRIRELS